MKRRKERGEKKPPLGSLAPLDLTDSECHAGAGAGGGWIPSDRPLLELGLLFGLADFKHDSGIPGRQKNSGLSLGSQSKITHVFISGGRSRAGLLLRRQELQVRC